MVNLENHPCFNDKARHEYGRVHLPVAPECNIQCNFCNRRYDCLSESRPGITSVILSPHQALAYLDKVLAKGKKISVVGIAGPGDPFANPEETVETLRIVRQKYPDMILCVATNGLNVLPYLDALADIKISHVSITINAVDPEIGAKICAWARDNKKIYRGEAAAELLLKRQLEAIKGLKERGITVKVNSIIIPEINSRHIKEIAKEVSALGADIMNPIALYPVKGSAFGDLKEPSAEIMAQAKGDAAEFLPIMNHCARCRADAVGLIGEGMDNEGFSLLRACAALPLIPEEKRSFVAAASREGALVNLHLGEAERFYIYRRQGDKYLLTDIRQAPPKGSGDRRWMDLAILLKDCQVLLAAKAGRYPCQALNKTGIKVIEMEGLIEEGLEAIFNGREIPPALKAHPCNCARAESGPGCRCMGTGQGCG